MTDQEYETILDHFYNLEQLDQDLGTAVHEGLNAWIDKNDLETERISDLLKQMRDELDKINRFMKTRQDFLEEHWS